MSNKINRWNNSIFLPEHQCLYTCQFQPPPGNLLCVAKAKLEYLECNPRKKSDSRRNQAARIKHVFFIVTITAALISARRLFKDAFLFLALGLFACARPCWLHAWGERSQLVVNFRETGGCERVRSSETVSSAIREHELRRARWQNVSNKIQTHPRAPINNTPRCCDARCCTPDDGGGQTVSPPPALLLVGIFLAYIMIIICVCDSRSIICATHNLTSTMGGSGVINN